MNKTLKILHLEDVSSDAELVYKKLKKSNTDCEILVVNTKDKFIKELKDFAPDIILADHNLPSFNSHEALTILRETGFEIPFIVVTATMSDEFELYLIKNGADDYILKDRLNRLPSAIENTIEKYRLKHANKIIINELITTQSHLTEAQAVAKVGSWETDLQTFTVKWSEETHHIFETDPKRFQVTHQAFLNFTHPDDRNKVNSAFENSFHSETINSVEHRIISTNGTLKHVCERWKIYRDVQGHPVRAVGTCQDITERKKAEQELQHANFRFDMIGRATNDALWEWDFETGKLWANETHQQLYGLTPADPVPIEELWKERIHPEDSDAIIALQNRNLKSDKNIFISEYRLRNANNEYRNIYGRCYITRNNEGNPVSMVGSMMDVTEFKKAEQSLAERERHLSTILQTEPECIKLLGLKGELLDMNPAGLAMLEADSLEQILHHSVYELITPQYRKEFARLIKEVFKGNSGKLEFEIIGLKGTHRMLETHAVPLKNAEGKIISLLGITRDITERKLAEEEITKLSLVARKTGNAVIITDKEEKIQWVNDAFTLMTGFELNEIIGKRPGAFLQGPETNPEDVRYMRGKISNGKAFQCDIINYTKAGNKYWTRIHCQPQFDSSEKLTGFFSIQTDITKDKEAEQAIYKLTERLTLATTSAKIGIWDWDLVSNAIVWDERMFELLGIEQDPSGGNLEAWEQGLHPDDKERIKKELEAALNGTPDFNSVFRMVWPDQSVHFIQSHGHVIKDEQGNALRMLGVNWDITEQKIAENILNVTSIELETAVTDLKKILDSSIDVICTINGTGEFVKVSIASQQVWGYTPEELIGTEFMNLVYHEDAHRTLKAAEDIANNIPLTVFENRYLHKSGRIVHMLWSVKWDEKIQLMFCIAKDVTERKILEKAVEKERDHFFDMFLKAPSAIGILKGPDHVFEIANPLYLQLTGKKDIIGKTVAEVLPEVIEQGFVEMLDNVYRTGKPYIGIETLVKVDTEGNGKLVDFYMNFVYQAYKNGAGEIEGVFFFINDITEQILTRKKIEKSEKLFKGVIENSDDMITMLDRTGQTIYASPAVSKKYGYTNEECLSLNIADVVHPDDAIIMQEFMMQLMEKPGVPMECPLTRDRKKDGTYIWVEGTRTNFLETEGINAIVSNFRDITERKRVELLMAGEKEVMEKITFNRPLPEILESIVLNIEKSCPGGICSILLLDNDGIHLRHGAAPHLPEAYNLAIDGVAIGESVGSCGTAAYKKEIVIVSDIATDPLWTEYRELALSHGLKACWSVPIITSDDKVLGTFAIYYKTPRSPESTEIELIERAANQAKIAIERDLAIDKLMQSEEKYRSLIENSPDIIMLIDLDEKIQFINNAGGGFTKEQILGASLYGFVMPEFHELVSNTHKKVISTKKSHSYETVGIGQDGIKRWYFTNVGPIIIGEKVTALTLITRNITERKNAEEANRFKANLLNTIGQAAIATDLNGMVNYWNRAAENIYGWTKEEALGKHIMDLTTSEATNKQAAEIMEELKKGQAWSGEFNVRKKDGTTFPALVTNSPIHDEHNILSGIIGVSSDITEKKKLEELLDKTNRLAAIGSFEIDVVNNTVFWSDITKEIREVPPDFIPQLNEGISYFKEGRDKEIITQRVKDCIENGIAWDDELEMTTHKGNSKWVRTIGEGEFADGKCIKVYGSFQDINARKKAEIETLKAYEEKDNVLESIGDGFYAVDRNWNFTYFNKEAESLLNMKRENVLGKNLWQVFPHGKDSVSFINYHKAVEENSVQHFQLFSERLKHWFEISAYPSAAGLSVYFRDISNRVKAQIEREKITADLMQRNKDLEQFSYIISHNLRAPVANIMGIAEELNRDSHSIEIKTMLNQELANTVKRLDDVIIDLNTILQAKRDITEKKEPVVLLDLVSNIDASIKNIIQEQNVQIKTDFSGAEQFTTIRSYIHSIFYNLISNSIKYHQPGVAPLIEIKSQKSNGKLVITFTDNGRGIDLVKNKDLIFGLYKRFHRNIEGKGMGLFMVKTQVETLGGNIAVSSEVNKGTVFTIEFDMKLK